MTERNVDTKKNNNTTTVYNCFGPMKYSLDRFNFWRFHRRHFSVEILKCRLYFSLNAFTACMHIFVNKCAVSLGPVVWYKWNMSLCNPCNIIYQFNVARRNCANLVGECNLCHFLRLSMNIWIEKRIGFPFSIDRVCDRIVVEQISKKFSWQMQHQPMMRTTPMQNRSITAWEMQITANYQPHILKSKDWVVIGWQFQQCPNITGSQRAYTVERACCCAFARAHII